MKRGLLLVIAVIGFVAISYAQSLMITKYDTVTYVNSTSVQDYGAHIYVKNISSIDLDIMCKRKVFDSNLCAFDSTYFCWDYCYSSTINSSVGSMPINAGVEDGTTFSGHVYSSNGGNSCIDSIRYTFYVDFDPNDSVSVTMKIMSSPTFGVEENKISVSKAYPNPASDKFKIELSELPKSNTIIDVYSLLGTKVISQKVNTKTVELNVSNLNSGIYVYTISQNGQPLETRKVVVKR